MSQVPVMLRMLGGIELSGADGLPVRSILAQPRRLALLLYLAADNHGGFHRKDTIRGLFWPEADAQRARQALNRAIYVLRQELGQEVLVSRGDDEVAVAEGRLESDVQHFLQAIDRGAREAALEIYRGDLAPGFLVSGLPEFERWMEAQRLRLRACAVQAATELMDRDEAGGRLELAERWAHRVELLSPHDERAAVRRISLLDRLGNRAAALSAFEDLEHRLRDDLEVAPSPETLALVSAIRSRSETRPAIGSLPAARPHVSPDPERDVPTPVGKVAPVPQPVRTRVGGRPILVGGLAVVLVLLLAGLFSRRHSFSLTTTNAVPITSEPGIEFQPALSPDGSLVAFTTVTGEGAYVVVRSAAGVPAAGEIRFQESDSEREALPTWSPNGERVRYVILQPSRRSEPLPQPANARSLIWREVDRLGGPVLPMDLPRRTEWVAWSRDGSHAAFAVPDSIFVMDLADHRPRLLAVHPGAWGPHSLAWSPDGRWIAYVNGNQFWATSWNTAGSELWLVDAERGERIRLTDTNHLNTSPAWLDARHLLFVSDREGQREVYSIEIGSSGPTGAPVKVPGGTDAHTISISADGKRLALARSTARQNVRSYSLGAARPLLAGDGELVTSGTQIVETHDVSPDGRWLAYDTNLHGDADIYVMPLGGGTPVPLITGIGMSYTARWSPDGREVAYYAEPGTHVWVAPVDGGAPTRLTESPGGELPFWGPHGQSIVFRQGSDGKGQAWVVTRERVGGPWTPPRLLTGLDCPYQLLAPGGTGILCAWSRRAILTLVSMSGAVLWQRDYAASGLTELGPPALSPDSTTLYLGATRGGERGIWALPLAGGEPRLVVTFAHSPLLVHSFPGTINVTRDRLYLTVGEFESDIWVMDLVRQ
jgi:serine/threonine-protein kinase